MGVLLALVCILGLGGASVVPTVSDYNDATAYLNKFSNDQIIEMLREIIDRRIVEAEAETAAELYNNDAQGLTEGLKRWSRKVDDKSASFRFSFGQSNFPKEETVLE